MKSTKPDNSFLRYSKSEKRTVRQA